MAKIVDGINMSVVKAPELKEIIKAFNDAELGPAVKVGVNPLGSAKAFVKAVEALKDEDQAKLPKAVAKYYNQIVVTKEEAAAIAKGGAPAAEEEEEEETAPPSKKPAKAAPAPKAAKTKAAPTPAAKKEPKGPTKKSIVISLVSKGKGATLDEMAEAITAANLDNRDLAFNKKIAGLWLRKLGFKVVKNEKTGKISKAI